MYMLKDKALIDAIADMYKAGSTTNETASFFHVAERTVAQIAKERGILRKRGQRPRSPIMPTAESAACAASNRQRVCQNCGNAKHIDGAVFCAVCGNKLMSKVDIAVNALSDLVCGALGGCMDKKKVDECEQIIFELILEKVGRQCRVGLM